MCVQPASRVFLDRLDAVLRGPRNRPRLVQDLIADRRRGREPAPGLHRLGDRTDLLLAKARLLKQHVRRGLNVLHLVREIHPRDLTRALTAPLAILINARHDRATQIELVRVPAGHIGALT